MYLTVTLQASKFKKPGLDMTPSFASITLPLLVMHLSHVTDSHHSYRLSPPLCTFYTILNHVCMTGLHGGAFMHDCRSQT